MITPTLSARPSEEADLIWCLTFQLAWEALREAPGEPVRVRPPRPLVEALNAGHASADDVDRASCFTAVIGPNASRDEVAALEMSDATRLLVESALATGNIVILSRLDKNHAFPHPFGSDATGARLGFRGVAVESFGVWSPYDPVGPPMLPTESGRPVGMGPPPVPPPRVGGAAPMGPGPTMPGMPPGAPLRRW
jgi:hypothetical protein